MYSDLERFNLFRHIIDSTMEVLIRRWDCHPEYRWIDMKLDAMDGSDHFDDESIRGSDNIYCWIQGRGLEAITAHVLWYGRFSGLRTPDPDKLRKIAQSVSLSIREARKKNSGHLFFRIHSNGESEHAFDGRYTMSDLFCSRGLFAYASAFGTEEEREEAESYLRESIKAVIDGRFYDDVEPFYSGRTVVYSDRTTFSGHMIALGGASLLVRYCHDRESFELGQQLIRFVLDRHANIACRWNTIPEYTIVDWIRDGEPARSEEGRILLNPGHSVEFTGLAAQFLIACMENLPFISEDGNGEWVDRIRKLLPSLFDANFRNGFRAPCGMAMVVDAETQEIVNGNMPWWGIPEAIRASLLISELVPEIRDEAVRLSDELIAGFDKWYFTQSDSGIAIQTIDPDGNPVAIIPATPDLDPGYHTGLSLISSYDSLAKRMMLMLKKGECIITPEETQLLCGHAARIKPFESVHDDLKCRILILYGPYSSCVLLSYDLIEVDAAWSIEVRKRIAGILGIEPDAIACSATHTHTGPSSAFCGSLQARQSYIDMLIDRTESLAIEAMKQEEESVEAFISEAHSDLGISRRYKDPLTGTVHMRPAPGNHYDSSIPILFFRTQDGRIPALIFNASVHPTTLGVDIFQVSADYPGAIASEIMGKLGKDCLAIPLTGACGDIRPRLLSDDGYHFREGDFADVERMGAEAASLIIDALNRYSAVKGNRCGVFSEESFFPFSHVPERSELMDIVNGYEERRKRASEEYARLSEFEKKHDNPVWAVDAEKAWADSLLLKNEPERGASGRISMMRIGSEVAIFFIPGELFCSVGMRIRNLWKGRLAMLSGYSDGILGYLPSREAFKEGGYEVSDSYKDQGFAGPFCEDLEDELILAVSRLIEKGMER